MIHKGTVTLETTRLILRRFTMADAEDMFNNWAHDGDVTKYLMWQPHDSIELTQKVLTNWMNEYEKADFYLWAIVEKSSNMPIGSISAVNQNDRTRMVHVGYCIGKDWWHKGYTTEALTRLIRFFFEEVGINRIESRHDPRNPNSGKVMQKAGLRYEGMSRESDLNNQGLCDAMHYAILANEYFGKFVKWSDGATTETRTQTSRRGSE